MKNVVESSVEKVVGQIRLKISVEKSRIRETKNLLTDAVRRTNTILERLRYLSKKKIKKKLAVDVSTRPRVHSYTCPRVHVTAPRVGNGRSAPIPVFRAPRVGDRRSAPTPRV